MPACHGFVSANKCVRKVHFGFNATWTWGWSAGSSLKRDVVPEGICGEPSYNIILSFIHTHSQNASTFLKYYGTLKATSTFLRLPPLKVMEERKKMRSFRGCRGCKSAKRRCTEEKPTCSACVKAGRECEV